MRRRIYSDDSSPTTSITATRSPRTVVSSLFLRALTMAGLLGSALVFVIAAPADAHTPHPTNGCSFSPDRPNGYNFRPSCDRHDVCYGHKPYGNSAAGRRGCDVAFRTSMNQWCAANRSGVERDRCLGTASGYFNTVRTYGCYAFEGRSIRPWPCWDRHT